MAEIRIEHVYECDQEVFWREIFFSEEYNRRLFRDALEFPSFNVVSQTETDAELRRTVEVTPKLGDMPGALKKLIGDNLGYRDDGVFDKKTKKFRTRITPNKLADKTTIEGTMWTEPLGERRCKRVFECRVESRVFGVGGLLEKRVIDDLQASYSKAAQFTNAYVKEKGL